MVSKRHSVASGESNRISQMQLTPAVNLKVNTLTSTKEDAHQWSLNRVAGWDAQPLLRVRVGRMERRLSSLSELSVAIAAEDIFDVWLTVHRNSVWIRKTN